MLDKYFLFVEGNRVTDACGFESEAVYSRFTKEEANKKAAELAARGYDVYVGELTGKAVPAPCVVQPI